MSHAPTIIPPGKYISFATSEVWLLTYPIREWTENVKLDRNEYTWIEPAHEFFDNFGPADSQTMRRVRAQWTGAEPPAGHRYFLVKATPDGTWGGDKPAGHNIDRLSGNGLVLEAFLLAPEGDVEELPADPLTAMGTIFSALGWL